jgi:hypothetical protein
MTVTVASNKLAATSARAVGVKLSAIRTPYPEPKFQ